MNDESDEKVRIDAKAVSFLARRAYATDELRIKLRERDFDHQLIEEVLAEYTERGWLDDEDFARHQAEILVRKEWGPRRIQAKLVQHGVPSEIARAAVDRLDVDWQALAQSRVQRRFGSCDNDRDRQRAFRHLTHRGFPPHLARRVVLD